MVVREGVPGGAAGRVVLAHGPPLTLGQVRSPPPPGRGALALLDQSLAFGGRLTQGLVVGAIGSRSAHAWTVSADPISVTGAGRRVTRSTSNASDRREVTISIVIS